MPKPTNAKRGPASPPRPAAKKGGKAAVPAPKKGERAAVPAPRKGGKAPAPAPASRPGWLIPAAVVGVVVALLLVAVVATRLDGDRDGGGGSGLAQTRPVTVLGTALPRLPQSGSDPALGTVAPVMSGASFDGRPVKIGGTGRPAMVFFVAHWCPHCQREVPLLAGELGRITPPGVEVLTVATDTRRGAENFPPSAWLEKERWPTPVLADDGEGTAAKAYGLSGFPYFVLLDREGRVVSRGSGEKPVEEVAALLKQVAPAPGS